MAERNKLEAFRDPLEPLLDKLSMEFRGDEDLSERLQKLYRVRQRLQKLYRARDSEGQARKRL